MDAIALHQYGFDCAVASLGTSLTEDHATLISRYVEQVILLYDGDSAGQKATRRAIPMLEKAGIQVKVLQIKDAKDPDEFLKRFGADKFKVLLEGSANRVEYQMAAIRRKYDLREDDQRVQFIAEAAEFVSTLTSAVQREIYGTRAAEAAGISFEAMKIEVNKAYKRRLNREKKQQEKIDLAPAQALRPKSRTIRYDNMRSAIAEEAVIALVVKAPALLDQAAALRAAEFSAPLLGRVYDQLRNRHQQGLEVSLGVLEDLTAEEMSHVAGILHRHEGPVNEQAFTDCVRTIHREHQASQVTTEDDLMALRNKFKESKGIKA